MGRGGYATTEFWDEWYAEEEHEAYDWLLAYEDVAAALDVLIPSRDARICVVGCGNSPFSAELFARGYRVAPASEQHGEVAISSDAGSNGHVSATPRPHCG